MCTTRTLKLKELIGINPLFCIIVIVLFPSSPLLLLLLILHAVTRCHFITVVALVSFMEMIK